MHTLKLLAGALLILVSAVIFTATSASAVPYGCTGSYAATIGEAHCSSPSWTGQVRSIGHCRDWAQNRVRYVAGIWVASGGSNRSWFNCMWLTPARPSWNYQVVGVHWQLR